MYEKRDMERQKLNTNNENIRSRLKKYDTYTPRPGIVNRAHQSSKILSDNYTTRQHTQAVVSSPKLPTSPLIAKKPTVYASKPVPRLPKPKEIALHAVRHANLIGNNSNDFSNQFTAVYITGKRITTKLQKIMYGFGLAVFIFSSFVSLQSFMTNEQAKEQIATLGVAATKDEQGVSEGTSDDPSEVPISENAILAYTPPNPEDPRYLRIPQINVFSRIKNLGITNEGAVATPKNIFDTGWYDRGARPGNSVGSSLILGHVSGWSGPGVFKNLNKLSAGSRFEIEKGSGEKVNYEVTRTEQLPATQVDMSKILATEVAGEHDIKLMTCSGSYNNVTKTYDDRFIVYAKQIK